MSGQRCRAFANFQLLRGYDPLNYNVPEEQFSQFTAPEDRMREFKNMVNEFHRNGIRVLMDVVYNHTANKDVLQNITGKYYTQTDLSATGNSIATATRWSAA
ncbi:alpha-amylase family glycosyl hydrolase [Streptomyces sp. NPDC057798]|uniref:alpha-amylase family glycosyl hydrolase n=1 Tax=Streptomyces sp. NPDC057798 TaxID=3346252 RepID=UPI003685E881